MVFLDSPFYFRLPLLLNHITPSSVAEVQLSNGSCVTLRYKKEASYLVRAVSLQFCLPLSAVKQ